MADPALAVNRLTFGPRPGQLAAVRAVGGDAFIEDQLSRTGPDPAAEARLGDFRILGLPTRREIVETVYDTYPRYIDRAAMVRREIVHSNLLRAVYSENQLFEMMCHLWMDHFNVQLVDAGHVPLHVSYQEFVIRPHAMGSFRDLLAATAHAPAMLQYLDNATSNANSPEGINENYGRELLELHSLGIHPDGSQVYGEDDVRAAAKAMSGWTLNFAVGASDRFDFRFHRGAHAGEPVSLLGGEWTSGSLEGQAIGESLLDFLATHPSTARYVAWKLVRRFVADGDRPGLVDEAAQVYLDNDTQLVPVLRHILTSRQFSRSAGRKVRRPFEVLAAMIRATGAEITTDPHSDDAALLYGDLDRLGHLPWHWDTPDGFPDNKPSWISTSGLVGRWNLAARMARGGSGTAVDPGRYRVAGATVGEVITGLADDFAIGELTEGQRVALAAATRRPADAPAGDVPDADLVRLAGLLLAHPTFQTR